MSDAGSVDAGSFGKHSEDVAEFTADVAAHAAAFVSCATEIAAGDSPDTVIPALSVQLAHVLLAGAMIGAVRDVVPSERFEPESGPDPDADPLRASLANLLEGIDEYVTIFDPMLPDDPSRGRVSDDVADVVVDLMHGLRHYEAGRVDEALWWWQFSYLSNWGQRALCAQRALLSMMSHQRLDADDVDMLAAEADALLADQ
jgi:hypothetical protein